MHFLVNPIKCSFLKLSLLIISFKFSSKNKVRKKLKGGALPLLLQTLLIYNLQLQSPHCDACVHAQSCLTLCNSMGCIPLGSSVQGIFQARILEWVAISSSMGSSQPKDRTHVSCISCIGRRILYHCATHKYCSGNFI